MTILRETLGSLDFQVTQDLAKLGDELCSSFHLDGFDDRATRLAANAARARSGIDRNNVPRYRGAEPAATAYNPEGLPKGETVYVKELQKAIAEGKL